MTNGGADYCFECIGLASLMNDAFKSSHQVSFLIAYAAMLGAKH
jgi:Zn-dependent alcohol dehydrogenase